MSSQGYFYTPEEQEQLTALQRKQAYARALLQSGNQDPGNGAYAGLRNAGSSIMGAILANKADKQERGLTQAAGSKYTKDLGAFLSGTYGQDTASAAQAPTPSSQISNSSGSGPEMAPSGQGPQVPPSGPTATAGGAPAPAGPTQPQAPQGQPNPLQALVQTGNPALMQQFGPSLLNNQLERGNKLWENSLPLSQAAQDQGALSLKNQEAQAQFTNQLPATAYQQAEIAQQRATTGLGYAQLNKPQFVPYGAPGYLKGGQYTALPVPGGGAAGTGVGDPASASAPVQLGLSSRAYNLLTGNTAALGPRDKQAANAELDSFFARSGLDPSSAKPQVQAYSSAINMNTLKANTMDTLAKEISGTVQNYGPVIDKLTGSGNLRIGNKGWELVGSAVNDPTAQQAIVYLNQMRADLAGFNAASGGKIGVHGQTRTDNSDFEKADEVIKNGLSSGGARALAGAVEATRQKNVAVAQQQVQEATRGMWNALGIGANYDATHKPQLGAPSPAPPQGGAQPQQLSPQDAAKLPPGTHFIGQDGVERVKH